MDQCVERPLGFGLDLEELLELLDFAGDDDGVVGGWSKT